MKKKLLSLLLTLTLLLALTPGASAVGAFADVTDADTAQNVEVLRLMGVIEGDNGAFRPTSSLTRAEFCKMAVVLKGMRAAAIRYGSKNVGFLDMKSHWAAGYVNYAADKSVGMLHGMPDGTFQPDRAVTYGEAVAILVRMLGYTDADTGGIWPDGYIALAHEAGMTTGVSLSGGSAITRAQAAKLFVNALSSKNTKGETLIDKLGYTADLSKDAVTLRSIDAAKGVMRLSDGTAPEMENPMESTVLTGLKGWVVKNGTKALTFLPATGKSGGAANDAAIIVRADGSTAGLDALTGGARGYAIYRNGVRVTAAALRKNDVATYSAASNAVRVCDARVAVYYENCSPSQSEPTTITALGGTTFDVLPTAQQSLARFKPGQTMVLLLTADGRVAGAAESGVSGNALAYMSGSGKASLICGDVLLPLALNGVPVPSGAYGKVVRVSQSGKSASQIYLTAQSVTAFALDLDAMTLGPRPVASDAVVIDNGAVTSPAALGATHVEKERVVYYATGSGGAVELIVLSDAGSAYYGRAVVNLLDDEAGSVVTVSIDAGGRSTKTIRTVQSVRTGDYVEAIVSSDGERFISVTPLTKLASVPASAWVGDTAVNYGGQTYAVSASVVCYNRGSGAWFAPSGADTALDAAKAYGGTMDCYAKDGVIRVIEVRS